MGSLAQYDNLTRGYAITISTKAPLNINIFIFYFANLIFEACREIYVQFVLSIKCSKNRLQLYFLKNPCLLNVNNSQSKNAMND
jgi:hypothetical protein